METTGFCGKNKWVSLGEPVSRITTGEKKVYDNLCYAGVIDLFHLLHGCKIPPERGFKIVSLSVSFLGVKLLQRGDLWWLHSQKFLLLVKQGKLWERFFLHLLNLKRLQLKAIFILTLGFHVVLHSCLNVLTTWQPASPRASDPRYFKISRMEVVVFL